MRNSTKQIRLAKYENEITALLKNYENPTQKQKIIQQCLGLAEGSFKIMSEKELQDCLEIVELLVNKGFFEISKSKCVYPLWAFNLVGELRLGNDESLWDYDLVVRRKKFDLQLLSLAEAEE